MSKQCILDEEKKCDECGECDFCDLNPFKRCDNCGKCIESSDEYRELKIDDVVINGKSKTEALHNRCNHEHNNCCNRH